MEEKFRLRQEICLGRLRGASRCHMLVSQNICVGGGEP